MTVNIETGRGGTVGVYSDGSVKVDAIGQCGLRGNDYLSKEAARELLAALAKVNDLSLVPHSTPATLHGATNEDEREGWNVDAITAAIEYGRTIEFSYEKDQTPHVLERRVLKPEALEVTNAGKLVVRGEDQDRDDTRVFRLDRIVGHVMAR